ncbi:MAG: hypothetical protein AB9869_28655 [Verrucomicrobiia bacterium]
MKIVAQDTGGAHFLVAERDEYGYGRVVDLLDGRVHDRFLVQAVLKFGYWEHPQVTPEQEQKIVDLAVTGSR